MTESDLHWIIESIDKQLSKINPYGNWLDTTVIPLLELRNNFLRKFHSDNSETDWSIKDPQAVKILKRLNWEVKYELKKL